MFVNELFYFDITVINYDDNRNKIIRIESSVSKSGIPLS